jgi:hypothetical protein
VNEMRSYLKRVLLKRQRGEEREGEKEKIKKNGRTCVIVADGVKNFLCGYDSLFIEGDSSFISAGQARISKSLIRNRRDKNVTSKTKGLTILVCRRVGAKN